MLIAAPGASVAEQGLYAFGESLLRTEDLDPVYCALTRAQGISTTLAHRLCLAYWCFYHLGASAYICEQAGNSANRYWQLMHSAAANDTAATALLPKEIKRWPRGTERRHFRGRLAVQSIAALKNSCLLPELLVRRWFKPAASANCAFSEVSSRVQQTPGFGPWIAFKVADMGERVLGYSVSFEAAHLAIYKDPRQGAALVLLGDWQAPITDEQLGSVVSELIKHWGNSSFKAPPHSDRALGVQEVETILCKYKSHVKGHYPIGKDIREVRHGLEGWGTLAQTLRLALPPEIA